MSGSSTPSFNDDDLALLTLRFPRIVSLGIDGTSITDRGLACLRGNRSLTGLFIKSKGISDEGIDLLGLETLTDLNLIDVRNTRVTDAKVEEMRKVMSAREAALKLANPGKRINAHDVWSGRLGVPIDVGDPREAYEKSLEADPAK